MERRVRDVEVPEALSALLLDVVLQSLGESKAEDLVRLDVTGRLDLVDYIVIASGSSVRHVSSIAERLAYNVKVNTGVNSRIEGLETGDWVLVDAGAVVVHVFRPEVRDFYNLDKLWSSSS